MKTLILLLAALTFSTELCATPQNGGETGAEALRSYDTGTSQTRQLAEFYWFAFAQGMMAVNEGLGFDGKPKVFCQPGHFVLSGNQVFEMLRSEIKRTPPLGEASVAVAVYYTIKDTLPCAK